MIDVCAFVTVRVSLKEILLLIIPFIACMFIVYIVFVVTTFLIIDNGRELIYFVDTFFTSCIVQRVLKEFVTPAI